MRTAAAVPLDEVEDNVHKVPLVGTPRMTVERATVEADSNERRLAIEILEPPKKRTGPAPNP
jgi:hypothetical protein